MSAKKGISVADANEKLRTLITNVMVAKQIQVTSEDSGVVHRIREELESLKREMVDLKTTKLPDIFSSLLTSITRRTGSMIEWKPWRVSSTPVWKDLARVKVY